ncbi:hypothetical protein BT96DRAFT_1058818 [Gymnopus androsaceus JB14]|uniref:F-box domain-containing protein n=1 Tax=Gymnopus androsaceus JB14 TaxID=1447944 RepID=A0A6A4H1T0_9AGAR|nr:hypothetical protein BT96DRAFT_1058818 [Gymnopus androsaceus JB14]
MSKGHSASERQTPSWVTKRGKHARESYGFYSKTEWLMPSMSAGGDFSDVGMHVCRSDAECPLFMLIPCPLQIPEVLENILSHCDAKSNQKNVLVCKLWSEVALDVLWHKVDDLERFLELFGKLDKLERDGSIIFKYAQTPSIAIWQRFEMVYQTRIRILSLCNPDTMYIPPYGVCFRQIFQLWVLTFNLKSHVQLEHSTF